MVEVVEVLDRVLSKVVCRSGIEHGVKAAKRPTTPFASLRVNRESFIRTDYAFRLLRSRLFVLSRKAIVPSMLEFSTPLVPTTDTIERITATDAHTGRDFNRHHGHYYL